MNHGVNKNVLINIHLEPRMSDERQGNRQSERERQGNRQRKRAGGRDRQSERERLIINIYLQNINIYLQKYIYNDHHVIQTY